MLDEEIQCELERLNREHQWLKAVAAKYEDLFVYEYGDRKLYCSRSVNDKVDEFEREDLIDEGLYHDVHIEANFAIACFKNEDGGRVYSWPPMFVVGRIARSGPGDFKRLVYEHWRRQLDAAEICDDLVNRIAAAIATNALEREPDDWRGSDALYGLWTVEDRSGEVIGALRLHERVQRDVLMLIAVRADERGIQFSNHDGGFTVNSAHALQAFLDDTIAFLAEREADEPSLAEQRDRDAA